MNTGRIRYAAIILLALALGIILRSRTGGGFQASNPREKTGGTHGNAGANARTTTTRSSAGFPMATGQATTAPEINAPSQSAPDYSAEEFAHVPDWMPRPVNALSARAEDATLRSDGLVEGILHFLFHPDHADELDLIRSHLESAGMKPQPGASIYSCDDPSRECHIRIESTPLNHTKVTITYRGIDHEKGCTCPTCGNTAENPNP